MENKTFRNILLKLVEVYAHPYHDHVSSIFCHCGVQKSSDAWFCLNCCDEIEHTLGVSMWYFLYEAIRADCITDINELMGMAMLHRLEENTK
jgi:hypothetical protein